ncbi:unnamed protein product [Miscanthus lutarioriparius]|uniref:Uncharacterized protein n=1 Tax=Miscanthus lutarioriparius TaxID=422564 RepID=A0A811QH67_9POAL|nr:unnamed protein product [Miscanthus lutarioriparius]
MPTPAPHSLSHKTCETLPEAISDVWSLQALHVADSYSLVEIPESIGKLRKLRTLNLSGCGHLKHLPESIGDCEMISSIDLCNCMGLIVLPNSIGKLQKLRTLNLSRCRELKCLPETIGDCKMISSIDLCNCEKLTVLPNSIGRNEMLRVLRLGDTKVERLPSRMPIGIGQLSLLPKLDLFVVGKGEKYAGISELADVSRIGVELRIRGRQYARWMQNQVGGGVQGPASFPFLRVMKLCDFPNLKNLHGLVELPCLELLELKQMSSLESISGGPFPSLMLEIRRCNALHHLPDFLGELCSLWKLKITDLPELTCLPESICRLTTSLRELEICRCPSIKSLPEGIRDLTALQSLRIMFCSDLVRRCNPETGEDWDLICQLSYPYSVDSVGGCLLALHLVRYVPKGHAANIVIVLNYLLCLHNSIINVVASKQITVQGPMHLGESLTSLPGQDGRPAWVKKWMVTFEAI